MFINYSNHASSLWSEEQIAAARKYGCIVDVPFIDIDPSWDEEKIIELAEKTAGEIAGYNPQAVMCQGEFTFTFALVTKLKERGIRCFSACAKRVVREHLNAEGKTVKESVFVFEGFREYKS